MGRIRPVDQDLVFQGNAGLGLEMFAVDADLRCVDDQVRTPRVQVTELEGRAAGGYPDERGEARIDVHTRLGVWVEQYREGIPEHRIRGTVGKRAGGQVDCREGSCPGLIDQQIELKEIREEFVAIARAGLAFVVAGLFGQLLPSEKTRLLGPGISTRRGFAAFVPTFVAEVVIAADRIHRRRQAAAGDRRHDVDVLEDAPLVQGEHGLGREHGRFGAAAGDSERNEVLVGLDLSRPLARLAVGNELGPGR